MAVEVRITLRMGKYDVIALHLQFEYRVLKPHTLLVKGELNQQEPFFRTAFRISKTIGQKLSAFHIIGKAVAYLVFAGDACHTGNLPVAFVGLDFSTEMLVALLYIVSLVREARIIEVRSKFYLLKSTFLHCLHYFKRFLERFASVVHQGEQVAVHICHQRSKSRQSFFLFK